MVYIVNQEGSDYYKIGYTYRDDVKSRLTDLQVSNPRKLHVIAVIGNGSRKDELRLHKIMSNKKTNGGKEWFLLDSCCINKILEIFQEIEKRSDCLIPPTSEKGWRIEVNNGVFWNWRKGSKGNRVAHYGGLFSELSETRRVQYIRNRQRRIKRKETDGKCQT